MGLISLSEVSLGFGGPLLLDEINLQIERGEWIGLLGRNGMGKSTLLKLVYGDLEPDDGVVARQQNLRMAFLPQEVPQGLGGSVAEIVAAGLEAPVDGDVHSEEWRLVSGVRVHPSGRIHVSGDGAPFGPERQPDYEVSTRRLLTLFPQLGSIDWAFHWSGWVAMTSDQVPHMHELAPGVLAGLGYSGRGIALATAIGRELARGALGTPARDLLIPASPLSAPTHFRFPALARTAVRGLMASYRLRDAMEIARYARGLRSISARRG